MKTVVLLGLNTRHTHSSLSLAYLEAFWRKDPSTPPLCRLDFDLNQGTDALFSALVQREPSLVAFSTYIWNLPQVLAVSGALKSAFPKSLIVLGGPEVSFGSVELMMANPAIDLIVKGEGEETFAEVLTRHFDERDLDNIPGTVFRAGSEPIEAPFRPLIQDLDSIPSPFQMGLYRKGRGFTYYEASRGCPFSCSYCLSSVLGKPRCFSLERVLSDLDWFMDSEFKQVRFADRTFNIQTERAEKIVEHILRKNRKNVGFHFELKADIISDSLIDLLGKAPPGSFHLEIGVQSTHRPTLEAVNRHTDLEEVARRIVHLKKRTRCHVHLDLLSGLPGETFPLFKEGLDTAISWKPDSVQVGWVKLLKGTSLEANVKSGEIFCSPAPPYPVVRTRWLSPKELVTIQDIGKLVENIFNHPKFPTFLEGMVKEAFSGSHASFFEALAMFWRETGRPFFQFSPESLLQGFSEFLDRGNLPENSLVFLRSVLLHEYRLSQKVPSGKPGPIPIPPSGRKNPCIKIRPGLRSFWYESDPLGGSPGSTNDGSSTLPAPVIYCYETDLSKPPSTGFLKVPLVNRFVIACIALGAPEESIPDIWERTGRPAAQAGNFAEALEECLSDGLVIRSAPAPKNGM